MKTKIQFMALALAAILPVSCSQDSSLLPDVQVETGSISFNVSLDRELGSRAGDAPDEVPSRCLLEVYDGVTNTLVGKQIESAGSTSYSFTVSNLEKDKDYTFVFWADPGKNTFNTQALTAITPNEEGHIAFSGQIRTKPGKGNVDVKLTHAVAKLSVVHSAANMNLSVGDNVTAEFTRQQYSFNARSQVYSPTTTKKESLTATVTVDMTSGEVLSLYMLAPNDNMPSNSDKSMMVSDFKLGYKANGATAPYSKAIPSVTFKANHRTVISGNIKNLSLDAQTLSVSLITDWATIVPEAGESGQPEQPSQPDNPDPVVPDEPITPSGSAVTLTVPGSLTPAMIQSALASGNGLKIAGPMNDNDFATIKTYMNSNSGQNVNLDLGSADIAAIPDDAFNSCANLIGITLPSSVTIIGAEAFKGTGIEEITAIGVTTLEEGAFRNCPNLKEAVLGNLKNVGNNIFAYCPNIAKVDLTRCTAAFTRPGAFFSAEQTVTIYVNEELIASFQKTWGTHNFNITWATK